WTVHPIDRVQGGLSVSFDASCEEMWLAWRNGAALIATPRSTLLSVEAAEQWMKAQRITVVSTVPSVANLWSPSTWSKLRLVILGGEPCPRTLACRGVSTELWNTYGPTEATVVTTAAPLNGGGLVTIGVPLAGWDVAVIDKDDHVVPVGQEGELAIAGVGLGRYLDRALDQERFAPLPELGWDRAYRTGDRVRLGPTGLVFLGRDDDQVKINGRRLELGQLDTALMDLEGVAAAACAVRESSSGAPILVAYVVTSRNLAEIKTELDDHLPAGLAPLLIEIQELPRATSGKVSRQKLPWPVTEIPAGLEEFGELGTWLTELVREQLGPIAVSGETNFFEIGGNSLAAAKFVSAVRSRFPTVGVADLYTRPGLGEFATWLSEKRTAAPGEFKSSAAPSRVRHSQALGVLAAFLFASPGYVIPLLAFNHFVNRSWAPTVALWELAVLWIVFVSPMGRIFLVAGTKWLLLGRVRAGRYPRGGRLHLSIWLLGRLVEVLNLRVISGTPLARTYAQLLGATIAKDVCLDTLAPTLGLLQVGAGSCIESDVELMNWYIEGDEIVIGNVSIGCGVRIGARSCVEPASVVCDDVEIEVGTSVSGRVEPGTRLEGAPAMVCGRAGDSWPMSSAPRVASSRRRALQVLSALLVCALPALTIASALPALLVLLEVERHSASAGTAVAHFLPWVPLLVLMTLCLYATFTIAILRLLRIGLQPGLLQTISFKYVRLWLSSRVLEYSEVVLFPLYKSMLTEWWLRRLGAKIGQNCEITTPVGLPWLLRVGESSLIADYVLFAPVSIRNGWARIDTATIGTRSFVGNSVILRSGTALGDDTLVATATLSPKVAPPSSSWLGAPAMEIPRIRRLGPEERTYSPPMQLKMARATIEIVRSILCLGIWVLLLAGVIIALDAVLERFGLAIAFVATPLILVLAGGVAWVVTVAGKWIVAGRYKEGEFPLWSWQVWRTEFVDALHEVIADSWFGPFIVGTTTYNLYLRTLGARIGRNVWCETWNMNEFDLITIGSEAYVSGNVETQTHLFTDRMLQTGRVKIGAGSTLETQSVVLPDSELGRHVVLYPLSLVMSAERLAPGTSWQGVPVVGR
ncbi:MAG TPA: Pls/PosA family non-ribosomal peptide synthetase, partial [Acidimicrobiales bacterium]|nr:Pls/PosA family non-ribosomal peptide synthetase [Acidimicrobiales bacterium]